MKKVFYTKVLLLVIGVMFAVFSACSQSAAVSSNTKTLTQELPSFDINAIKSFRDIPGVTEDEIKAIEAVIEKREKISFGQMLETEAFILPDGTYSGFTPRFCELLSRLFGIEFSLELYEWDELINGIDNLQIDFTGDLTPTEERMTAYYMSLPIAERRFSIFTLSDAKKITAVSEINGLKVGFWTGSVDEAKIRNSYTDISFTAINISNVDNVVDMLKSGKIDLFASETVVRPIFNRYDFMRHTPFFQMTHASVSLTTKNPDLKAIISVVDKFILAGGIDILYNLYSDGENEYARNDFLMSLLPHERQYLEQLVSKEIQVPVAMECENYPQSFYNEKEREFQGIAVDLLSSISDLTGIIFNNIAENGESWAAILNKLETGEAKIVSELVRTEAREGRFLWTETPYCATRYALITKNDYPMLESYQVARVTVGMVRATDRVDIYRALYPNNNNVVYFDEQNKVIEALMNGSIDLMMSSEYEFLTLTNFLELPGYKLNMVFESPISYSTLGFNKDEALLCSIIDKAIEYIDVSRIEKDWTSRTFNYERKMAEERAYYANQRIMLLVAVAFIMLLLLILILILFLKNRKALSQAREANKAKSVFLSHMSHEIRTPMNAILGITEIQLRNETLSPETGEAFEKIYESGDLLLNIINDMLDLSKIESGKMELVSSKYDIPSLINDTVQLNILRYDSKPIVFLINVDADTPKDLYGDELRIKQILNNILSNAFKYTDEGKIEFAVSAELNHDDNITLIFRVSDTGQGMTEDQLEKLFDEYTRFNLEANRNIVGAGLGMSITKRLVDLMNGKIFVQSCPGKGSVITVYIPQKRAGLEICGREITEKLQNFNFTSTTLTNKTQFLQEHMPYGRVLVVDDVESNIYVVRGMLLPYGIKIDSVSSGIEAVKKIKDGNEYDIIFMDHMMPKMDGIEATKIIRNMGYKKTIVALTANALTGRAEMFLQNGFDRFLSKPIDSRELNLILIEYIRNKQLPEVVEAARTAKARSSSPQNKSASDELVTAAAHDIKNAISALEEFLPETNIENDNLGLYITTVHGLKSALANVGEMQLSASALKLEKEAENTGKFPLDETHEYIKTLKLFLENLKQIKKDNSEASFENSKVSQEDIIFLQNKMNEIKTACESFIIKDAKSALNEAKQKKWSDKIKISLDEITIHLLRGEYTKAVSIAEKIIQESTTPP